MRDLRLPSEEAAPRLAGNLTLLFGKRKNIRIIWYRKYILGEESEKETVRLSCFISIYGLTTTKKRRGGERFFSVFLLGSIKTRSQTSVSLKGFQPLNRTTSHGSKTDATVTFI